MFFVYRFLTLLADFDDIYSLVPFLIETCDIKGVELMECIYSLGRNGVYRTEPELDDFSSYSIFYADTVKLYVPKNDTNLPF